MALTALQVEQAGSGKPKALAAGKHDDEHGLYLGVGNATFRSRRTIAGKERSISVGPEPAYISPALIFASRSLARSALAAAPAAAASPIFLDHGRYGVTRMTNKFRKDGDGHHRLIELGDDFYLRNSHFKHVVDQLLNAITRFNVISNV